MPKTLRAAAAGSCRTSAVTPLSSRLSQWASAAGLVPTGLCRWPLPAGRTSWFSALAAPASALPSALVRVASNPHDCASRLEPPHDLRRRPVKATHRGGIQRPMRTDLAFGSPPAEQSTLRVVPSEPGHRSRRGVYLALSSLPPLLLLELHGPRDLNPRTGKVDNRARRQVSTSTQVAARRRAGISDLPSPGEVSRAPCRDGGGQQSKATMRKRVRPPGSVTRSIMPSGGSSQERASDGPARSGPGEGALRETGGGLRSRRRGTWSTRPPTGEHPHSADQFPRRR